MGGGIAALAFYAAKNEIWNHRRSDVTRRVQFHSGNPPLSLDHLTLVRLPARAHVHTLLQWDTEENQCMRKGSKKIYNNKKNASSRDPLSLKEYQYKVLLFGPQCFKKIYMYIHKYINKYKNLHKLEVDSFLSAGGEQTRYHWLLQSCWLSSMKCCWCWVEGGGGRCGARRREGDRTLPCSSAKGVSSWLKTALS